MKKTIIFRILGYLILFHCTLANAQESYYGKIIDENEHGLPLVNVFVISKQDSTILKATVTDNNGIYKLNIQKGEYIIKCSYIGYTTSYLMLHPNSENKLPNIQMAISSQLLNEVEKKGKRPTFRMVGNALFVDVENDNILKKQTDIYDVLSKIPGIIRSNKSISVMGKGIPIYYIDGRKVFDMAEIQNLSVDQIKSIKVVNSKDVKYDSGNSAVIDIKTKRLGEGLAFNILNNMQVGNKFSSKSGINLGYIHKHWDWFLNYTYNRNNGRMINNSDLFIFSDTIWNKKEQQHTDAVLTSHNYQAGMVYHFSKDSQIGIQYTGSYNCSRDNTEDSLCMSSNKDKATTLNTNTNVHDNVRTHHINLYYNLTLGNKWEIGACGDYFHKSSSNRHFICEKDNTSKMNEICFNQSSDWDIIAMNIHSSHGFQSGQEISMGYDFSHTLGTESIDYQTSSLHSATQNEETKNALYIKYNIPMGHFSLNTGLRYEYINSTILNELTNAKNRNQRHFLLPSVAINYSKGALMQSLNYSIELQHPNFTDMNANLAYSNRYAASIGNLNLKTEVDHSVNYMLLYKFLYFNFNYTYIHHPILSNFSANNYNSSVILGQVSNFSDRHIINGTLNLRHTIKQFTPSFTFVCMKSFFQYSGLNNEVLHDSKPLLITTLGLDVSLPSQYLISATYFYNWGGDLQMMTIGKESSMDISINKSFFNNRLTVSLGATDIFDNLHSEGSWMMNNLKMNTRNIDETRKLKFSVIYRFRNKKKISTRNAANKEISRLKINEESQEY